MWNKGAYLIAGGPPFILCRKEGVIHDEAAFEAVAEYPTFEAAVMHAELLDDAEEAGVVTVAAIRDMIYVMRGGK